MFSFKNTKIASSLDVKGQGQMPPKSIITFGVYHKNIHTKLRQSVVCQYLHGQIQAYRWTLLIRIPAGKPTTHQSNPMSQSNSSFIAR